MNNYHTPVQYTFVDSVEGGKQQKRKREPGKYQKLVQEFLAQGKKCCVITPVGQVHTTINLLRREIRRINPGKDFIKIEVGRFGEKQIYMEKHLIKAAKKS